MRGGEIPHGLADFLRKCTTRRAKGKTICSTKWLQSLALLSCSVPVGGMAAAGLPVRPTQWTVAHLSRLAWDGSVMALLHFVSARADQTDPPKSRNVALWRRENVLLGTSHSGTLSLLSHVPAALRSLRAPLFLDPSFGTSGPICRQL